MSNKISYKKSGVNYDVLDPIKKMAQLVGLDTSKNLQNSGFMEIKTSRGESAYVIEGSDCYYGVVSEGLGTKNLVADQMRKITGKTYYDVIAQDTVAAIINDLVTTGAKPLTILAYWAVGDSKWFTDKKRARDLTDGWKKACDLAGATWGAGETPALQDIVYHNAINLAGSAFGIIQPKSRLILGDKLTANDVIILFESNGIHANGLTLARSLAKKLPERYATKLANGKTFGEELLKPSLIYSRLVQDLIAKNVEIHYLINITGHGWCKIMRAKKSFRYIIDSVPEVPILFQFIQKHSGLSDKEMYATFNMGAGFAMMVDQKNANKIIRIANKHKIKAWIAGRVEKGQKEVIIRPLDIIFKSDELKIR